MAIRYIQPKSLTWWAGIGSIATGVVGILIPDSYAANEIGRVFQMISGGMDSSPAALIFMGLGLIGIRDRLERAHEK